MQHRGRSARLTTSACLLFSLMVMVPAVTESADAPLSAQPLPVQPTQPQDPNVLTLDEAVLIGLANHPNLRAARERIGAQDVVSLGNRARLQSVVTRELRAFRLERALNTTLSSAREYKQQLQAFMTGSADAIAHVAEVITSGLPSAIARPRLIRAAP